MIIITIYYRIFIDKRQKNHIYRLEKNMKDTQDIPNKILTDEEFDLIVKKFKNDSNEIFYYPNNNLDRLYLMITTIFIISALLIICI